MTEPYPDALRITHYASRITHYALRITHYASRITHYALRITHYATRVPQLGQNIAVKGIWKLQTVQSFWLGVAGVGAAGGA